MALSRVAAAVAMAVAVLATMGVLGTAQGVPATDPQLAQVCKAVVQRLQVPEDLLPPELSAAVEWATATLLPNGTWPDVDYKDASRSWWFASEHLRRCLLMATAVSSPNTHHTGNTTVGHAADKAFLWWVEAKLQNQWWWMQIGQPRILLKYLLLRPNATLFQRSLPLLEATPLKVAASWTGCNRVWGGSVHVLRACAENNITRMDAAYGLIHSTIHLNAQHEDGLQVDGSFHQHGPQLYSGWGYGAIYSTNVLVLEEYASGTRWMMNESSWDLFSRLVLTGQQLATRGPNFDFAACGRLFTYFVKTDQFGINQGHYHHFAAFSPFELAFPQFRAPFSTPIGVFFWPQLARIDSQRPNAGEFKDFLGRLEGTAAVTPVNKHFYDSDYMVHHRPNFTVTVRMFSNRTINTECVNDENKQGRDLADGITATYLDGREYESVFPVWRWKLLPGTTEAQTPTEYTCGGLRDVQHTSWVGGVSDGLYGAAAMDFQRGHEYLMQVSRSWFFFDDVVLVLGGGFESNSPFSLATSLEQSNLRGPVFGPNGQVPVNTTTTISADQASWVWHANTAYAQWPTPSHGSHATKSASTAWPWNITTLTQVGSEYAITQGDNTTISLPVFGLYFDHGVINNAGPSSFAYGILPATDKDSVEARVNQVKSTAVVVTNKRNEQVVCDRSTATTFVVAWPNASFPVWAPVADVCGFRFSANVHEASFVMLRDQGSEVSVHASNPDVESRAQRPTITVNVQGEKLKFLEAPGCVPSGSFQDGVNITIQLPTGGNAGDTVAVSCPMEVA